MILHSIVSEQDIFYNMTDKIDPPVYKRINGGLLEFDGGRLTRLISTDPKMYLDRRYFPTTDIKK